MARMNGVTPIEAFSDNYIWVLPDKAGEHMAVVDPGDAQPVLDACEKNGWIVNAILITHFHADHVGGIKTLLEHFPGIPVYGPTGEGIEGITDHLYEGDMVVLPEQEGRLLVWEVPGHTAGHIAYVGECCLFCGDTLFSAGCGRVFTGTHEQLSASLERIKGLPEDINVFCAHEYTLDNIGFAKWVEPDNQALLDYEKQVQGWMDEDRPSLPSRIGLEREVNPFLRCDEPAVIAAAEKVAGRKLTTPSEVFRTLREWKDRDYD